MATEIEPIWLALLDRVRTKQAGFATITRKPKAQYGIEEYPVLELVEIDEDPEQEGAEPPHYTLTAVLNIVCRVAEGDDSPFTQMNALLLSLRSALERNPTDNEAGHGSPGHYTDLGGLVEALSIGRVEKRWGQGGGEVWAKVPIEITTY